MNIFELAWLTWLPAALLMTLLWWRQSKTKNANAVDVAWALLFSFQVIVGLSTLKLIFSWHTLLTCALTLFWSLRLGLTLYWSRVHGVKLEDPRYLRLRRDLRWGQKQFFIIYQFQALLVVVLSLPIWISLSASPKAIWTVTGILIGLIGIFGESLADHQLKKFLTNPENKNKTCNQGLWKYSRHPNYFFEWVYWWSYVALGMTAPHGLVTLIGPALMLWFLVKVTGIPALERISIKKRLDYLEYQKKTSAFIPWFPKK